MALSVAASASAQTKLAGKVHCAKADPDYSIEVSDEPGHVLSARKAACTWKEGGEIAGLKVKAAQDVATGEVTGATARDTGYHVATMDNGDQYHRAFQWHRDDGQRQDRDHHREMDLR